MSYSCSSKNQLQKYVIRNLGLQKFQKLLFFVDCYQVCLCSTLMELLHKVSQLILWAVWTRNFCHKTVAVEIRMSVKFNILSHRLWVLGRKAAENSAGNILSIRFDLYCFDALTMIAVKVYSSHRWKTSKEVQSKIPKVAQKSLYTYHQFDMGIKTCIYQVQFCRSDIFSGEFQYLMPTPYLVLGIWRHKL